MSALSLSRSPIRDPDTTALKGILGRRRAKLGTSRRRCICHPSRTELHLNVDHLAASCLPCRPVYQVNEQTDHLTHVAVFHRDLAHLHFSIFEGEGFLKDSMVSFPGLRRVAFPVFMSQVSLALDFISNRDAALSGSARSSGSN